MSNRDRPKKNAERERSTFSVWFWGHVFSLARRHGNIVAFWLGIGYCIHEIGITVRAFAGTVSLANLGFSLFANVSFVWTVNIALSGISVALYFRERTIHRKTRERLTSRITMLELKVDSSRTSSHLTPKGLTQKEDE